MRKGRPPKKRYRKEGGKGPGKAFRFVTAIGERKERGDLPTGSWRTLGEKKKKGRKTGHVKSRQGGEKEEKDLCL